MAQTFYHISRGKKGGPAPCSARPGHCPLGGQHFNTMHDAQVSYEAKLIKQYGRFVTLSRGPKYHFYNAIDNHPRAQQIHRNIRILKRVGKVGMVATGLAISATMALTRFTASTITGKKMGRGRSKINAKKLLMTKYWMPNIHSNKWR